MSCLELVIISIKFHIFGATDELDEFLDSAEISPHDSPIKTYMYGYDRSTLIDALRHMDVFLPLGLRRIIFHSESTIWALFLLLQIWVHSDVFVMV